MGGLYKVPVDPAKWFRAKGAQIEGDREPPEENNMAAGGGFFPDPQGGGGGNQPNPFHQALANAFTRQHDYWMGGGGPSGQFGGAINNFGGMMSGAMGQIGGALAGNQAVANANADRELQLKLAQNPNPNSPGMLWSNPQYRQGMAAQSQFARNQAPSDYSTYMNYTLPQQAATTQQMGNANAGAMNQMLQVVGPWMSKIWGSVMGPGAGNLAYSGPQRPSMPSYG